MSTCQENPIYPRPIINFGIWIGAGRFAYENRVCREREPGSIGDHRLRLRMEILQME
jgi:hypothetical protein